MRLSIFEGGPLTALHPWTPTWRGRQRGWLRPSAPEPAPRADVVALPTLRADGQSGVGDVAEHIAEQPEYRLVVGKGRQRLQQLALLGRVLTGELVQPGQRVGKPSSARCQSRPDTLRPASQRPGARHRAGVLPGRERPRRRRGRWDYHPVGRWLRPATGLSSVDFRGTGSLLCRSPTTAGPSRWPANTSRCEPMTSTRSASPPRCASGPMGGSQESSGRPTSQNCPTRTCVEARPV